MQSVFRLMLNAFVIYLSILYLPGIDGNTSFWNVLFVSLILAVLNTFIKPLLVLLTLPISFITFGLFLLVINAAIILLTAYFSDGLVVSGFWPALLLSLMLSFANALFSNKPRNQKH